MKKSLKSLLLLITGGFAGVAITQALLITAERPIGVAGGEMFIPLALPLLVAAGYWMGRDTPHFKDYDRGYKDGHRQGAIDQQKVLLHPHNINCRHTIEPYDCEKDASGL